MFFFLKVLQEESKFVTQWQLHLHVIKHLRRVFQKVLFAGIKFTAIKVDTSTKYVDKEKWRTKG